MNEVSENEVSKEEIRVLAWIAGWMEAQFTELGKIGRAGWQVDIGNFFFGYFKFKLLF